MSKRAIRIGRVYPTWRINAYECEVDSSNAPIRRGKYVRGWYGTFTSDKLENEIMPKLAEWAAQGWSYPFLITSHQLESKATVHIIHPKDLKYSPRKRQSKQAWLAVVLSPIRME